jgi:hypothetical protein
MEHHRGGHDLTDDAVVLEPASGGGVPPGTGRDPGILEMYAAEMRDTVPL